MSYSKPRVVAILVLVVAIAFSQAGVGATSGSDDDSSFIDDSALSRQINSLYKKLAHPIMKSRCQHESDRPKKHPGYDTERKRAEHIVRSLKPNCTAEGSRKFYLIAKSPMTWDQALAECQKTPGWTLARIFSQYDYDRIKDQLTTPSGAWGFNGYWLNARTSQCVPYSASLKHGNFKWGGTPYFVTDFLNKWAPISAPTNYQPDCNGPCMRITNNGPTNPPQMDWDDVPCDAGSMNGAICEDASSCQI